MFRLKDEGPYQVPRDSYANGISQLFRFHSEGDGLGLTARIWRPKRRDHKRTIVFAVHGFCEYTGRYLQLADFFNRQGFIFAMSDLRGHGDSDGARSHVTDFKEYVSDTSTFYKMIVAQFPDRPIMVLTHSMGGLIVAQWIRNRGLDGRIKAVYMSSPLFGVKGGVYHVVLDIFSQAVARLVPNFSLFFQRGVASYLTHDEVCLADRLRDKKVNRVVTMGWTAAMHRAATEVFQSAVRIPVPFFLAQAGFDTVVSNEQSKKFFDQVICPNKRIKQYPGLFHEIFNEVEREVVLVDLINWIQSIGIN